MCHLSLGFSGHSLLSSMSDVKEPLYYSKRVRQEVPGPSVFAVPCEYGRVWGKVIYLAWDLGSRSYITWHFCLKVVEKKSNLGVNVDELLF